MNQQPNQQPNQKKNLTNMKNDLPAQQEMNNENHKEGRYCQQMTSSANLTLLLLLLPFP